MVEGSLFARKTKFETIRLLSLNVHDTLKGIVLDYQGVNRQTC